MRIRTLLTDDEPLALERLRGFLQQDPEIEIVGECLDGLQTLEAICALKPDLLFLDIQMPELDGFEVVEALEPGRRPLIVFATAYDQYALKAFQARALDYLLKPFSGERLREAVDRAKRDLEGQRAIGQRQELEALLKAVESRPRIQERLVVRDGEGARVIPVAHVEAIEAEANYMWVHRGQDAYPLRGTLAVLEARLEPLGFLRTHRSWLLNLRQLREIRPGAKGGLTAITLAGLSIPVSMGHRKALEEAVMRVTSVQR